MLSFLKTLEGGFNVGILCIDANKSRVDEHEFNDIKLIGRMLGQKVFDHSIVLLTRTNLLTDEKERAQRI